MNKNTDYYQNLLSFIPSMMGDSNITIPDEIPDDHPVRDIYRALFEVKENYSATIEKAANSNKDITKEKLVLEERVDMRNKFLIDQDLILEEKNTLLETSLNILSHDTKNLFFNLNNLILDIRDKELSSMLRENMGDLTEIIQEATSILTADKNTYSVVDMIKNTRVSKSRIAIEDHKRITLEYKSEDQLFLACSALFKNVIYNLTENALKYTSENSGIIIKVERDDSKVVIQFIDSGRGISDEEKEKITDKFYRCKSHQKIEGSGRGLWITKNIIRQEGGELHISDNPKGGTIFSVTVNAFKVHNLDSLINELAEIHSIPHKEITGMAENFRMLFTLQDRSDIDMDTTIYCNLLTKLKEKNRSATREDIYKRLDNLKQLNKTGKTVIVVDDSIYVQYYLGKYFAELGYRIVGFAENGKKGINAYKKLNPDIITLDNTMPVLSGLEAAKEILQYNMDARIIFISALADSKPYRTEIEENYNIDNYRILTKPIEKKDLEKILNNFPIIKHVESVCSF